MSLESEGQTGRKLSARMPWLVLFMTAMFPFLLAVLLFMDLVELDPIRLESPLPQGKNRPRRS